MGDLGQLVITGVEGKSLTKDEESFLEKENIGGVILFANNYESPAQLAELVNQIQRCRNEYPLFISVDHEGGRVCRFREGFSEIPAMLDVGKTNSPKIAFHLAKIMAEELTACGVNLNFSPVCDILTNPQNKVIGDRAFATNEEDVSKFVSSFIRGFQTNGLMSCAKHFPGHGSTKLDSHFDLPIVKNSLASLKENEFKPFVKAIKSRVDFIMMAHLVVDDIDQELPTSLSKKAYDILRDELRFNGIIITDDMEMKAISDRYSYGQASVMAIGAGADIVEYRSMEKAALALDGLKEAKKNKELKLDDLNKKYERILACKKTYLSEYTPLYIPEIAKKIKTASNMTFLKEVMDKIAQA